MKAPTGSAHRNAPGVSHRLSTSSAGKSDRHDSPGDGVPPWEHWHDPDVPVRVGVSACLLGDAVRYDGGDRRNAFVADALGCRVDPVGVCPEVEGGMGVPRPAVRLEEHEGRLHMVDPKSGADHTGAMSRHAARRVRALLTDGLDGYVFKKGSPSCGPSRVRVYAPGGGGCRRDGAGLFAAEFMRRAPGLPVEDERRLGDPVIRVTFVEHVFCANRWRVLAARGRTRARLVAFHTAHEMLLLAHNEAGYRRMGRLVAQAGTLPVRELFTRYEGELHRTLRTRATPRRHANVLQHALGYLKNRLAGAEKREIQRAIDDMRAGLVPPVVPRTLLRDNIRRFHEAYLAGQLYFDPHPKELMLRNHA